MFGDCMRNSKFPLLFFKRRKFFRASCHSTTRSSIMSSSSWKRSAPANFSAPCLHPCRLSTEGATGACAHGKLFGCRCSGTSAKLLNAPSKVVPKPTEVWSDFDQKHCVAAQKWSRSAGGSLQKNSLLPTKEFERILLY